MEINAAVVRQENFTFVVIIVKKEVLDNSFSVKQARDIFRRYFPLYPIVLMAQDARYNPIFDGPLEIVEFLSSADVHKLPWSKYTVK